MRQTIAAFAVGLLFGLGLTISQMVSPAKVLAFLDLAGAWDPSLALVMGGALAVAAAGFRLTLRRPGPLLADGFRLPTKTAVDARLIGGAALFGIGWGLAGLCPGPALAGLAIGGREVLVFLASMAAGILVFRLVSAREAGSAPLRQDG